MRPDGWSEESHGDDADPNYAVVFPQDKVNQLTITIDPDTWEAMQANMTELFGEPGTGGPGAVRIEEFRTPEEGAPTEEFELPAGGGPPREGGREPGVHIGDLTPENPMWVTATVEFDGNTWTNVGIRYKGNSSLRSSWDSKTLKLPLKLDFDEFEDDYPEISNQRFYGFKQLSLSNNFGDASSLRETVAYDLLEEAGLVAAETGFYEVILDYGEGPVSLGLYTAVEVIDDTVVERVFGDDSGNIYEADGPAASLAEGTADQIEDSFQKENNEQEADWSDIEALYEVLHSEERTGDPEAWRASLESIFDVNAFLKWLAISAAIQHWDTYGAMAHNYYLYHDPETGRLMWISWDHNFVLGGMGGGMIRIERGADGPGDLLQPPEEDVELAPGMPGPGRGVLGGPNSSLDKADIGEEWPLIRYLLDDPTYYDTYIGYLEETSSSLLDPEQLGEKYQQLAELIAPIAAEEAGEEAFEAAVQELTERTQERAEAVREFLAEQ